MKFKIEKTSDSTLKLSYTSSKEQVYLGTLTFVDDDGDVRDDILKLFLVVVLREVLHPMIEIVGIEE